MCRISWHFSVRRQLLPVSVSVTLAPPITPNPPYALLSLQASFVCFSSSSGRADILLSLSVLCRCPFALPLYSSRFACRHFNCRYWQSICALIAACSAVSHALRGAGEVCVCVWGSVWVTLDCVSVWVYSYTNAWKFCLLLDLYQPASLTSPSPSFCTACSFLLLATFNGCCITRRRCTDNASWLKTETKLFHAVQNWKILAQLCAHGQQAFLLAQRSIHCSCSALLLSPLLFSFHAAIYLFRSLHKVIS